MIVMCGYGPNSFSWYGILAESMSNYDRLVHLLPRNPSEDRKGTIVTTMRIVESARTKAWKMKIGRVEEVRRKINKTLIC